MISFWLQICFFFFSKMSDKKNKWDDAFMHKIILMFSYAANLLVLWYLIQKKVHYGSQENRVIIFDNFDIPICVSMVYNKIRAKRHFTNCSGESKKQIFMYSESHN